MEASIVLIPGCPVKELLFLLAMLLAPSLGSALGAEVLPKPTGVLELDHIANLLAQSNLLEGTEPQAAIRVAKEGLLAARQQKDAEKEAAFLSSIAFSSTQTGDFGQAVQLAN